MKAALIFKTLNNPQEVKKGNEEDPYLRQFSRVYM